MNPVGYSGKPLAQKLGLKEGVRAVGVYAPTQYFELLQVEFPCQESPPLEQHDFIHAFYDSKAKLISEAQALKNALALGGMLWLSWPKKTSGNKTDLSEQDLRDIFLPMGIVDTKVCAVDATWSGLKFMHRTKKSAA